ncbi:MAG: putative rRNA maturation factor [Verrucomicrobiales bacterium]
MPELELYNCQEAIEFDLAGLNRRCREAFEVVLSSTESTVLAEFDEVEMSIVGDEEIARIHGEFMDDPTPTDVITFQHGELVISAETAAQEANSRSWPVERELLLYLIHGFLHLQGFDDHEPEDRERMHAKQNAILDEIWPPA